MERRRYLATVTATAAGLALAGCSDDEEEDGDSGNVDGNGGDGGSSDGGSSDGGSSDGGSSDGGSSDGGSSDGGSSDGGQSDIELLDHEFYEDDFSVGVRGTAQNNTDGALSYVEANAVFLDADGTQIGDGLDNVNDLAAGRKWEFECMFLGDDAERIDSYEIEVSTGF